MATDDEALAWLESVAMRPMLESLLENVCKDKPNHVLNYAVSWMRSTYGELALEATRADEPDGEWYTRDDVDATPEGLMEYLKVSDITTILEAICERAIRAQPANVVAYVIDELAALRSEADGGSSGAAASITTTPVHTNGVLSGAAQSAAAGHHPRAHELVEAVQDGAADTVRALLAEGVPPDSKDESGSKTALAAAAEGEIECMEILLAAGANVDQQTKAGETALIAAVHYEDIEIISMLLRAGADARSLRDIKGKSALDYARDGEKREVLEVMDPAAADRVVEEPGRARPGRRRNSVSSESVDPKKLGDIDLGSIPQIPKDDYTIQRISDCISGHLLFKELDEPTMHALILSMSEKTLQPDEYCITQGDEDAEFFYIVAEGSLNCYVKAEGIEPPGRHVMTYGAGTTFGELALMYNTPRAASVVATEPSLLWVITRDVFRLLILTRALQKRQRFEEIISTVPLLKSMEQYERTVLADAFEEEFFPQGTEIVREGEMGDKFYILLEGECSAIQEDTGGQQTEVLHYEQGGHFGELALLRDTNRQATVKAVTDVRCVMLDKTAFERLLGPVKDILARDAANYAQHL